MKLHLNKTLFRQAVRATSQLIGLQEIYIEKDFSLINDANKKVIDFVFNKKAPEKSEA